MTGAYPVLHVGSFGSAGPAQSTRPWARTFRGTPASVPEARRFVAELLAGCPAREVLMTCVSELSANAIAHTGSGNGGVFIVEVDLPRPGVARIAVTDQGGPSLPAAGPSRPDGRGRPRAGHGGRLHQPVGLRRRLPGPHRLGRGLLARPRPLTGPSHPRLGRSPPRPLPAFPRQSPLPWVALSRRTPRRPAARPRCLRRSRLAASDRGRAGEWYAIWYHSRRFPACLSPRARPARACSR